MLLGLCNESSWALFDRFKKHVLLENMKRADAHIQRAQEIMQSQGDQGRRFGNGFIRPIQRIVIEFHGSTFMNHFNYSYEFFNMNHQSLEESINEKLQLNGETGYIKFVHCASAVVPFFDTRLKVEFREKKRFLECTESELEELMSDYVNHRYPGRNELLEARLLQTIVQQCMQESSNDFYKQINIAAVEDVTQYDTLPHRIRRHLRLREKGIISQESSSET